MIASNESMKETMARRGIRRLTNHGEFRALDLATAHLGRCSAHASHLEADAQMFLLLLQR